jgi:hypothetical protein
MAHYSQQYQGKTLKALAKQYHGLTPKVRFMKYVRVNAETGCWEWLGGTNGKGYGTFVLTTSGHTGSMLAHRAAWLLFHGPIPVDERHTYKTYGVLHHCDNKACVAPAHLFLGTQRDNALDAVRKHGHWGNGGQCGEACSWRKLNAEQVQAIWLSKATERELAAQYGVSHGTIGDIKRRRSWRRVTEGLAVANNIILTPAMAGILEGPPMADVPAVNPADVFPRYGFSATEPGTPVVDSATGQPTCNSRLFENTAELDAAGGTAVWSLTPAEAAKASTPAPRTPVAEDDEETPARRSHR